jgi:hypothetical protein
MTLLLFVTVWNSCKSLLLNILCYNMVFIDKSEQFHKLHYYVVISVS